MKRSLLAILSATALFGTGSAHAALYDFTFDGHDKTANYVVKGVLTTASTINQFGGYDVTSISGTVNGTAISGMDAATPSSTDAPLYQNASYLYDNSIFAATSDAIDGAGLAFHTASADYNLGNQGGGTYYLLGLESGQNSFSFALGSLTLAYATPEAATWAMLILGFGLIGALLRSAHRRSPALGLGDRCLPATH